MSLNEFYRESIRKRRPRRPEGTIPCPVMGAACGYIDLSPALEQSFPPPDGEEDMAKVIVREHVEAAHPEYAKEDEE